jgi:formimidoylglutamate deiminase
MKPFARNLAKKSYVLRPELLWLGGRMERGMEIVVANGRIDKVRAALGPADWSVALMPGFVNAHSHAFQRGMRGLGETFTEGEGSFFTWRHSMYDVVETLSTASTAYDLTKLAYDEMLDAGITSVGEFHYIHHAGRVEDAAAGRWNLDSEVLRAGRDVGIRQVLLHADYVRGGFDDAALEGGQRRFDTGSVDDFLASVEAVEAQATGSRQSVAMVVHSTRAVPIERISRLRAVARTKGTPFHIHLEEVMLEIDDCRAAHGGATPMRLLLENGVVDELTTAVHCTHSTPEDLADFAAAGGIVCLCPNTEGNLGDGICDLASMRAEGARIAIGTDLNSRISPAEDLRWLEYVQRVANQMRGAAASKETGRTGASLIEIGTDFGAQSLGLNSGVIAAGKDADFAAIDLEHRSLEGVQKSALPEAIVFGTGPEVIAGTCVAGEWLRLQKPPKE